MNEKTLAKICLILSIFGILLMIPFYQGEFPEKTISTILELEDDQKIKVDGYVELILKNNNSTLFFLNDGNRIQIYSPEKLYLEKNEFISVLGITKKYNGKKEVYAYKVIQD